MPDTSAGADDVARLAMWPFPRVRPSGDSSFRKNLVVTRLRERDAEMSAQEVPMVGAIFRLRLSRRAQCEKNVETGDEHTMRMRFQSRKSDTSRNKATNFPRNTAPSRQPIFGLWYLTQHKAFSLFRFSARFSLLLHLKTRFDAAANRARRAYTHTYINLDNTRPTRKATPNNTLRIVRLSDREVLRTVNRNSLARAYARRRRIKPPFSALF